MSGITADLLEFVAASPTPWHCVEEVGRRLGEAGFRELDEGEAWERLEAGRGYYVVRAGSIIAFRVGTEAPERGGYRLLGAHTDSPNLRLKPRPDVSGHGYRRWGVEVYGGALLYTWLDRDLGVSGRVFVRRAGGMEPVLFRCDEPVARVPSLAIHLQRELRTKGLHLDEQKHLPPIVGLEEGPVLLEWLGEQLDEEVLSFDLMLHDLQPPAHGGMSGEFVFAPRLDNQASCHAALEALLRVEAAAPTQVLVFNDHEEIGSRSMSGAMGPMLRDVLSRIGRGCGTGGNDAVERALARSWLVSLDMAHAVHPNFSDRHEPEHRPVLNGGPVVKEHVEQRYATDAETQGRFRLACELAEVPVQDFVSRTDLPCGSTIGPITAGALGVRTVDVGNPMLSMHSVREQAGSADHELLIRALIPVLEGRV